MNKNEKKELSSFFRKLHEDELEWTSFYQDFVGDLIDGVKPKTNEDCSINCCSNSNFHNCCEKENVVVKHENGKYEISVDTCGYKPENVSVILDIESRTVTVRCFTEKIEETENGYSSNKRLFEISQRVPEEIDIYSLKKEIKDCGRLVITGNDFEEENHVGKIIEL